MHVEGIILNKTPYKERDLICHLLLRTGKKMTIYFYGGRGGGKSHKGSILEVGFMLAIELGRKKKSIESDMFTAKEYRLLWRSDQIRQNYQAFYLESFFLEYVNKIAIDEYDDDDHQTDEHAGLFNVLSNALFYLDESLSKNNFESKNHLFIFLAKLSAQLGIVPAVDHCIFCDHLLSETELCLFDPHNGGFSCVECASQRNEFLSENHQLRQDYQNSQRLRSKMKQVFIRPYKEYGELQGIENGQNIAEFNFINYQFGFRPDNFRSWKLLIS